MDLLKIIHSPHKEEGQGEGGGFGKLSVISIQDATPTPRSPLEGGGRKDFKLLQNQFFITLSRRRRV